jgi:hypothetical protein
MSFRGKLSQPDVHQQYARTAVLPVAKPCGKCRQQQRCLCSRSRMFNCVRPLVGHRLTSFCTGISPPTILSLSSCPFGVYPFSECNTQVLDQGFCGSCTCNFYSIAFQSFSSPTDRQTPSPDKLTNKHRLFPNKDMTSSSQGSRQTGTVQSIPSTPSSHFVGTNPSTVNNTSSGSVQRLQSEQPQTQKFNSASMASGAPLFFSSSEMGRPLFTTAPSLDEIMKLCKDRPTRYTPTSFAPHNPPDRVLKWGGDMTLFPSAIDRGVVGSFHVGFGLRIDREANQDMNSIDASVHNAVTAMITRVNDVLKAWVDILNSEVFVDIRGRQEENDKLADLFKLLENECTLQQCEDAVDTFEQKTRDNNAKRRDQIRAACGSTPQFDRSGAGKWQTYSWVGKT